MSESIKTLLNPTGGPDVLWRPDVDGFYYPDSVERTAHRFNNTQYEELITPLQGLVRVDPTTGLEYAVWSGDEKTRKDYSTTDAIVVFSTFASRADNNMLLRHAFVHQTVDQIEELCDESGKKLPLIFLSAPANDATYPLDKNARKMIAMGDLGPAATPQLELVRSLGFERVRLLGFSQGASMVAAASRVAGMLGVEVVSAGAASSPNAYDRFLPRLLINFASQAKYLEVDLDKGGIEAFRRVHQEEFSVAKYARAIVAQPLINAAMFRGLAKGWYANDFERAFDANPRLRLATAVASGENDKVSPTDKTRTSVAHLRQLTDNRHLPPPHHIDIENGNHTWGDRIKLLTCFYLYSLLMDYNV